VTVVEREIEQAEQVVEDVVDLETAKDDIDEKDHAIAVDLIDQVIDRVIERFPVVRVRTAAALLNLTPPTVYKWVELGLLEGAPDDGTIKRVTMKSVLRVRPLVLEVQRLGRKRNLLEAVLARVEDGHLRSNLALRRSIGQWERNEVVRIDVDAD